MEKFISNENERLWLEQTLSSPDDPFRSGTRYSKIFVENIPSIYLSLDQLITLFPTITPRTYTCASSPLVFPNSIHLCGNDDIPHIPDTP